MLSTTYRHTKRLNTSSLEADPSSFISTQSLNQVSNTDFETLLTDVCVVLLPTVFTVPTSCFDTASDKEIWDFKIIPEKAVTFLPLLVLIFYLKHLCSWSASPSKLKSSSFAILLTETTTKRIKQLILASFPISLFNQTFPWPC